MYATLEANRLKDEIARLEDKLTGMCILALYNTMLTVDWFRYWMASLSGCCIAFTPVCFLR
jgi:hypothetical protein